MSESTEHRESEASERSGRREIVLDLGTARRMLPLVSRIVDDILALQKHRRKLGLEQEALDEQRHSLAWPSRQRRYQVQEDLRVLDSRLAEARGELEQLGVAIVDAAEGRVGLPTIVNKHLAFFSWRPGDEGLRFWHFAGETVRRTIPPSWKDAGDVRLMGKR